MTHQPLILGLNSDHPDAAAALLRGGQVLAAVEEERFTRVKHWSGLPTQAIKSCLELGGISVDDLDYVVVNHAPGARHRQRLAFALATPAVWPSLAGRMLRRRNKQGLSARLSAELGSATSFWDARLRHVEHHRAHLASAFYASGFQEAACVSVDAAGDFATTLWGTGCGSGIEIQGEQTFPHGLGHFYLAMTQFLGFPHYGDEYKLMGLSAQGTPRYRAELSQVLRTHAGGRFSLDLRYFRHHAKSLWGIDTDGSPRFDRHWARRLERLLGPARMPGSDIEERHADLAASVQAAYEDALFGLLNHVASTTGTTKLALAGGCAQNSLANGKIPARTPFRELYVPAASGDSGGALGAALAWAHEDMGLARSGPLLTAALGPPVLGVEEAARQLGPELQRECVQMRRLEPAEIPRWTAHQLAAGKVIGWVQGRLEWGPRALGQRSILADPRQPNTPQRLNEKIKRREGFRPFAPAVLKEQLEDWFETRGDHPFMSSVVPVRPERRALIPAVVHKDGTARVQTVGEGGPTEFRQLLEEFGSLTGVPILLNTSFNENEPIVTTAAEAIACFLRTKMDGLVIGDRIFVREEATIEPATQAASSR